MEVILHLGAHRTASAGFQHYLHANRARLAHELLAYWGPVTVDNAVAPAVPRMNADDQLAVARDRIQRNLDRAEQRGIRNLIISDVNVIGTLAGNFRDKRLYPAAGERMARYFWALGGRVTRVALTIRSQDTYWSSAAAWAVAQGQPPIRPGVANALAFNTRGWRDVITDLACALPEVPIFVQPFEMSCSQPDRSLSAITDMQDVPALHARHWLNRSPGLPELRRMLTSRGIDRTALPEGPDRWQPFDRDQILALRETYADDLYWLRAGADGLATLIEENRTARAGKHLPAGSSKRGQTDGKDDRRLA